jgi:hypothetical protein
MKLNTHPDYFPFPQHFAKITYFMALHQTILDRRFSHKFFFGLIIFHELLKVIIQVASILEVMSTCHFIHLLTEVMSLELETDRLADPDLIPR